MKAYTISELTSAGWTKVTSISDVDNNYYVFVDAGSSNYAMGRLSYGTDRPVYQSLVDPLGFNGVVWYLGANGDNYTIRSIADDHFFISGTQGWNDNIADQQWGNEGLFKFTATLPEGKFSIQSVQTNSYVGPWNNDNKVALDNGYENIAANKAANQAPGFYLYSIPRAVYNANRITASWLTSHGWSQVIANSALGNTDNYYLIIEKETFGYAMARTSNGRPASKSLSNPFATKNELWLIAAKGSGYSLQNVVDGTYFTSAAGDWNTSMSNTPNADIIATVSEGVYTLSAGGTSSIGHWRDDKFFPYENENVAANKNDNNRNSYYIYTISKADYATQRAAYLASLASSATSAAPVELTNFIFNNSDFATLAKLGWTVSGTWGNQQTSNGAYETWNSNNVSVTQELANMPGGKYKLTVQMVSGNDGRVPYLYANADKEYITNVTQQATTTTYDGMRDEIAANPDYGLLTVNPNVTNGTLTVGMKAPSGWVVFDNFKLSYYGPTLASSAVVLPNDGVMAAGQWYYFDIAVAGDNYNATATNLGDIICFSDGNTLVEEAISGDITLKATDNSFAAKRYYVKSSSANNLVVAAASYSYEVSEASADKAYIQPSQTVTVSYTASTNDPDAVLAQDYSGVTFDGVAIDLVPDASGFHFTTPANLEAGVPHTLYIPAEAIGYADGDTYNAEQSIVLNATAVYDGIYFLKVAATYDGTSEGTSAAVGKYLARGMNYGTHATLDKYGLPVQITTDGNNVTTIQAYDTKRYFFHGNTYDCYADQASLAASGYFTVTLNNGKLLIHNNSMAAGTYLKYNTSAAGDANIAVFDDGNGTNSGPIIMWTTENASGHATVMQSYKDGQAATAAAAAYASGNYESLNGITTVSALEAELEANYIKGDFVKPSTIESVQEKYQGGQPGSGNITETVYSNTINITEPGFYKFSMLAFYRAANNEVTQNMHTNGVDFPPVALFFGNSETQIKSVYDEGSASQIEEGWGDVTYNGQHYPNNTSASLKMFQGGHYHNDVYFYASEPGEYTYGVKYMGFASANAQWFIYSPESVEISSYAAAADAADYTALQDAIDAYDAATWGFETGEYAPYNNATAIEKIADAKAINPAEDNSKLLVNSLTAYLTLTANATEVNAFGNDGAFSTTKGWQNSAWVATEGNYVGVPNGTTITYGNIAGYTVPLKANTIYELKLRHSGWDKDNTDGGGTVSMLLGEDGLKDATYNGNPSYAKGDDNTYLQETFLFKTGAAGNYVFTLRGNGGRTTVKGFSLVSVPSKVSVEFGASGFATFACDYPVALPDDESVKGYTASIEDATISFNKLTDKLVPANTGVMLSGTPNSEMKLDVVTSADAQSSDFIRGTGAAPGEDNEYYFFAIKKSSAELTFGTFNPATLVVAKNKAYLKISKGAFSSGDARLTLRFDDTTAINAIEAAEVEDGALKDGKYIIDNKIVIVKNGVKYSTNGQKLN